MVKRILNKANLIILFQLLCLTAALDSFGQSGTWTWVSGSSAPFPVPNFGIQGVPAATNQPRGVYEGAEWTDLNGDFWIFGGLNASLFPTATLWKYDVATSLWTWMKGPTTANTSGIYGTQGIPSPTNEPGARGWASCSWTDLNGNLWLFGGSGYDALGNPGALNDLWKYDIATNEWTWMSGSNVVGSSGNYGTLQVASPSNLPPPREETAANWVDNAGNLWLFSGSQGSVMVDDMWKYDIATNQWTWMSGQSSGTVLPNYGTLFVSASTNTPGGRCAYTRWKDKQGNFWLFGGTDFALTNISNFNDMWMYNPITNLWTWMAGSATPNGGHSFTQFCIPGNGIPSSAYENRCCWTDDCGRFWSFGGFNDFISTSGAVAYNTLWMFDPSSLEFTWINGSLVPSQSGNFGIQNVPAATNVPPGLVGNNAFRSLNGDLWMFGGFDDLYNTYNTLWRYQIDPTCPPTSSSVFSVQPDSVGCVPYATQFVPFSTTATSYHWDFGDATILSDTSNQDTASWIFNQAGTYPVTLITSGNCGADTSSINIRIGNPPILDLGVDTAICAGQTIALNTTIPGSYSWSTGDTTASILVNAAGQFSVQITTDTFNCIVNDTIAITVTPLPTPNLGNDTTICNGQTLLLNPGTFNSYQWNTGDTTGTITANAQGNYAVIVSLNNCSNSDTIAVTVDELPLIGIGIDSVGCNIVLDAGNPGASYLWNTGETTQTITATQTGTYSVTITNGACVVLDSITITGELGGGLLYIPNAFTPDQNGLNEKFQPIGTNIVGFSMSIYNRWGELVYATNDITKGWDGRSKGNLVQQDVYVYSISYKSDCLDGKQIKKMGQVTVIR